MQIMSEVKQTILKRHLAYKMKIKLNKKLNITYTTHDLFPVRGITHDDFPALGVVGSDAHAGHIFRAFDAQGLVNFVLHREPMGVLTETSFHMMTVLVHPTGNDVFDGAG